MSYDTTTAKGQTVGANQSLHAVENTSLTTRIELGLDETFNHLHEARKILEDVSGTLFGAVPAPPASSPPSQATAFEDRMIERLSYMTALADQIRLIAKELGRRI